VSAAYRRRGRSGDEERSASRARPPHVGPHRPSGGVSRTSSARPTARPRRLSTARTAGSARGRPDQLAHGFGVPEVLPRLQGDARWGPCRNRKAGRRCWAQGLPGAIRCAGAPSARRRSRRHGRRGHASAHVHADVTPRSPRDRAGGGDTPSPGAPPGGTVVAQWARCGRREPGGVDRRKRAGRRRTSRRPCLRGSGTARSPPGARTSASLGAERSVQRVPGGTATAMSDPRSPRRSLAVGAGTTSRTLLVRCPRCALDVRLEEPGHDVEARALRHARAGGRDPCRSAPASPPRVVRRAHRSFRCDAVSLTPARPPVQVGRTGRGVGPVCDGQVLGAQRDGRGRGRTQHCTRGGRSEFWRTHAGAPGAQVSTCRSCRDVANVTSGHARPCLDEIDLSDMEFWARPWDERGRRVPDAPRTAILLQEPRSEAWRTYVSEGPALRLIPSRHISERPERDFQSGRRHLMMDMPAGCSTSSDR